MLGEKAKNFHKSPKEEIKTMVEFDRTTSNDLRFRNVVKELDDNLYATYHNRSYRYDVDISVDHIDTVILACIKSITIGGGCFKEIDSNTVEFKRMFVNPYFRGLGVASGLLDALSLWAKELNYTHAVLETGNQQEESIKLFKKHEFSLIENFGPYINVEGSICMGKKL